MPVSSYLARKFQTLTIAQPRPRKVSCPQGMRYKPRWEPRSQAKRQAHRASLNHTKRGKEKTTEGFRSRTSTAFPGSVQAYVECFEGAVKRIYLYIRIY